MQNTHVQITPRMVPAPPSLIERRSETVRKLTRLGMLSNPDAGTINPDVQDGWTATINGIPVLLADYAVEPDEESGDMMVTLVLIADSLTIGEPQTGTAAVKPPEKPKAVAAWGTPGRDPREGIAGWTPESVDRRDAGDDESAQ